METRIPSDAITSNVMAWGEHAKNMVASSEDEATAEADEPPERQAPSFTRTSVHKRVDNQPSLLTRALQKESEDEESSRPTPLPGLFGAARRRRSMNSNVSLASTAELTSDTGITSPARTNTPSPPPVELRLVRLDSSKFAQPRKELVAPAVTVTEPLAQAKEEEQPVKKRSISFACMGKPRASPTATASTKQETTAAAVAAAPATEIVAPAPRRPCIRFACALKPDASAQVTPKPRLQTPPPPASTAAEPEPSSPATIRKARSPSRNGCTTPSKSLRAAQSPAVIKCKKYLEASSNDLQYESSRFHEFASDEPQEEDWIRRDSTVARAKITINDTLLKENRIRRIGKEAEEEAEQEEQEDDEDAAAAAQDDDDEDEDGEDGNEDEEEFDEDEEQELGQIYHDDEYSGYDSDDDVSDGYHQDEECGFADSGDEEGDGGDDGDYGFWTPSRTVQRSASAEAFARRPSMAESHSDSSAFSASHLRTMRKHRAKTQRIKIRPGTPELPDSTDFVCGTFDEDRPLEDAYLSCMAQKKREKLKVIPQDIDPSFPTSDPEDEDEERFNPVHHDSDDDNCWMPGDMEDIHHNEHQGERGRKKSNGGRVSPRRFHSPPPKRGALAHSPPPRNIRGRQSPKPLFNNNNNNMGPSPRRISIYSPTVSPGTAHQRAPVLPFNNSSNNNAGGKRLVTQAKSLPRDPALFPQMIRAQQQRRGRAATGASNTHAAANATNATARHHVRGAIDIVKGLEQKRQRRKEKYYQKYCHRARKGQIPDRRPVPGQGAERMRELGLLMAGKATGHGNYVLSV